MIGFPKGGIYLLVQQIQPRLNPSAAAPTRVHIDNLMDSIYAAINHHHSLLTNATDVNMRRPDVCVGLIRVVPSRWGSS